jgi:hypothetical protein
MLTMRVYLYLYLSVDNNSLELRIRIRMCRPNRLHMHWRTTFCKKNVGDEQKLEGLPKKTAAIKDLEFPSAQNFLLTFLRPYFDAFGCR